MGVLVSIAVAQFFHQFGGCIADGEGDRKVARFFHLDQGIFQRHIGSIALGGGGQINGGFRQGNATFRHADLGHHLEAGIGQQEGVGIGEAHILRRTQAKAPGNEQRILSAINHAGKVIDGRIRVRPADALDKGGNDVIMHLPILVIDGHVFLNRGSHGGVVDDDRGVSGLCIHHQFQNIEKFAGISSAVSHQGLAFLHLDVFLLQKDILFERPVQEDLKVGLFQRFQDKDLAAGKQGSDDLEGRVLRRGADQDDGAVLHGPQKCILLSLVKTVDLVDKENGSPSLMEKGIPACLLKDFPHILHAGRDSRQGEEIAVQRLCNDVGEGGLAYARRTPENE